MALANQAALLDELMGVYRNNTDSKVMLWNEDIVCKHYLAGFCPHELFVNTKEQLGPCPNHHDQNLLRKYKESSRYRRMGFEKQLQLYLERFVQRRETRIIANRERLNEAPLNGNEVKKMGIIEQHKTDIGEMIDKIESLANEGKVAESQFLFTQMEEKKNSLKYDELELEKQRTNSKVKEDDVCEICGAIVSKNDLRSSSDNHENGRIHCGYMRINEVLVGLKELIVKIDANEDVRSDNGGEGNVESDRHRDRKERKRDEERKDSRKRSRSKKESRRRSEDRSDNRKHRNSSRNRSRRY